ncbi:3-deoxy-7-phosphoheptulonate synthase [Clostridium oryzae]|uniref:Phospho-2-dehydro-3-deoxyheptonate aldolase n=1 Tax=Clostridium oryzae TaxID=1450648 RepID=A0A1V4IBZ7_9CLOT|nr:3-deoxy-7-phosphoheptulonate synthase [Clostridium oryzae]OPJ57400.1 phospho-2-dehydro-3-deoxyheptonate aldolase [Clostridium oryzae]
MVIIMKKQASSEDINHIKVKIEKLGCKVHTSEGESCIILGVVGDTSSIDTGIFEVEESVDKVMRVQSPYKRASRAFHPSDTVINLGTTSIGGNNLTVIAGPCAVENETQLLTIASAVKKSGATILRGGAFKPRTSPYSFQGLKEEGLKLLKKAKDLTGLPVVTEVMSIDQIEVTSKYVDMIQIGARNMQNFELLKAVGKTDMPVLLKRGLSATIEEFLMAAEYIMASGNEKVILCERGIRTYETYTRNTLDISAVLAVKKLSHLPIIVDPSHASGRWWMVEPLSKAAVAVGADGIAVEVHNDPANALSDGEQSIKPEKFTAMMHSLSDLAKIQNKTLKVD